MRGCWKAFESALTNCVAGRRSPPRVQINIVNFDWMPDGAGFIASELHSGKEVRLLHVDLRYASQILRSEPGIGETWGVPSTDGRYLAMHRVTGTANVWMVENP